MQKNKTRLYFRSKHLSNHVFSSEIFDNHDGEISVVDSRDFFTLENKKLTIKKYHNINEILNDAYTFTILTDGSFTESELKMMRDIVYANGAHMYGDEKVMKIVHKIEQLLMSGNYLPDNKNEIINK